MRSRLRSGASGFDFEHRDVIGIDLDVEARRDREPDPLHRALLVETRKVREAEAAPLFRMPEPVAVPEHVPLDEGRRALLHRHEGVQARMSGEDVIGLDEVLVYEFPVGRDLELERTGMGHRTDAVARELLVEEAEVLIERRHVAVHVHEQPVMPLRERHLEQLQARVIGGHDVVIPAATKVGATPQPPGKVVAPGVVRADDRLPRPLACVDEPCSPVPADVLECANLAALPAHEDHRYAAGIDRLDVAGAPDLVGPAGQHPAPAKEVTLLEPEEFAADVGRVGKTGCLSERRLEAVKQRVRQEVLHSRRFQIDSPAMSGPNPMMTEPEPVADDGRTGRSAQGAWQGSGRERTSTTSGGNGPGSLPERPSRGTWRGTRP